MHEESSEEPSPVEDAGAPGAGSTASGPTRGRRAAGVALTVLGVVLAVVVVAGFLVHLPYVIISPGVATPLDDSVLTIDGAPTYPHAGDVRYLTVRVSGSDPNVWKLLLSKLDSDKDVVEREKVVGCLSDAENVAINARLMQQSQDDATKVALERLDYVVTASPPESTILEVCAGAPAYGTLRAADQIIAIDDHPVGAATDIAPLVQAREPGDPLRVTIVRDGTTQTVEVTAGRVVPAVAAGRAGASGAGGSPDGGSGPECVAASVGTGAACLGIVVQTFTRFEFPIDVNFDIARVGGPSAGLAFALAIIDDLTPGDLTGGERVAVTGAITGDGVVQVVGGVEQKAITAREDGVDLMLVPRSEVAAARRGAGSLRVVGVDTIDDALSALQEAGGSPVPPPAPTSARS